MENCRSQFSQRQCLAEIDIFVLAGGLGTRIRPIIGDTPKLLARISDRTYLDYLLDWLAFFGAKRLIFGLGHGAQAICDELKRYPRLDLSIVTVIEPQPLGTAGAIGFSRNQLHSDPVLVLNGDSFVNVDLCEFVAAYSADQLGAVLCTQVNDGRRYGVICVDANGNIQNFIEKHTNLVGVATISAGIYLLSAKLLDSIAASGLSSLERDIFPSLKPGTLRAFVGAFDFIDIGTPESLKRAEGTLKLAPFSKSRNDTP